jgi:hypothetical protein
MRFDAVGGGDNVVLVAVCELKAGAVFRAGFQMQRHALCISSALNRWLRRLFI